MTEALTRKEALLASTGYSPTLRSNSDSRGLAAAQASHAGPWPPPPSDDPQGFTPILVPIRKAVEISGLSRSTIYLRAKAGELTLKKAGKTTLVDYASLRALLDGLPTARLKTAA